ncbi:MAG: ATP-binding protein [Prevotella sp.]|uniref:ATP-binding protein n=1 Tax=Prevotella sp. TaxID=59823 RepID=UPI0025ED896C|nr:ATP-binding protein [Prevotella sp.]MED9898936.1 ATP-binding protein [Prevotella sp.]
MKEIKRNSYLKQLISGKQNGLIKIVTGIRRCGKSYLLFKIFRNHLLEQGVTPDHIISLALDDILNEEYCDPKKLVLYIKENIKDSQIHYVLLDEVQMVDNFVGALNSLLHIDNVDVYVTGSNSKFLSSDIATEFRGRGDEIRIYPLSFSEFLSEYNGDKNDAWRDYITYGGLPLILSLESSQQKSNYLHNLYQTVYLKDLIDRNGIKKAVEFDALTKVMASSIGSPCNPNKLSNTFKSVSNTDLSSITIDNYLGFLQDAFLLEKASRYDIKGKKYIGTLSKYYFVDMGLRNCLLGFRQIEETHLMENVIYNELRSRGYLVDVGVVETRTRTENQGMLRKQLEIDFVVNNGSKRYYIQSALSLPNEEKIEQEMASLKNVSDSFQKIIIVKDNIVPHHNESGILFINLYDFLLNREILESTSL